MQDLADAELNQLMELSYWQSRIYARAEVFMQELRLLCKTEGFYARLHRRTIARVTLSMPVEELAFMQDRKFLCKS